VYKYLNEYLIPQFHIFTMNFLAGKDCQNEVLKMIGLVDVKGHQH